MIRGVCAWSTPSTLPGTGLPQESYQPRLASTRRCLSRNFPPYPRIVLVTLSSVLPVAAGSDPPSPNLPKLVEGWVLKPRKRLWSSLTSQVSLASP